MFAPQEYTASEKAG